MKPGKIGIVGPCAAGKTTLIRQLRALGYDGKHIAQEHSYVPHMWKRITNPDILVYLHVSYPVSIHRRQLDWTQGEYDEQIRRLEHARLHADLIIDTDHLSPLEVLDSVLQFITSLPA
jgi:hypothetical protein